MSDGHWAPKSDFLNNSRSCGFINNLGSGGGYSGSGTTTSSSNYSVGPPGATSCHQQQNNGAVGQQHQVINNSSTTTAQQPRVATSLDALLADLDQLTGGLPDLGSRRQQPKAVDSWGNSHNNNNSRSNGGAKNCGEVGRKNSALQKSEIEGIYDIHALIRKIQIIKSKQIHQIFLLFKFIKILSVIK